MTTDRKHLCDDAAMYAMDGLDNDERIAFEKHLKECPECRKDVNDMKELVDFLPLAVEDVQPPVGMKSRILAHVLQSSDDAQEDESQTDNRQETVFPMPIREEDQRSDRGLQNPQDKSNVQPLLKQQPSVTKRSRLVPLLSAASVVLLALTSMLAIQLSGLKGDKKALAERVSELEGTIASSNAPVTGLQVNNVVALKPTVKDMVAQGLATIVIDNKGTHLIVQAENLPELKDHEAFQVWLLKGDKPVNAGTFFTKDGSGALVYTFPPDDYDTIAITQEPDANGNTPRGTIVLAAPLKV